MDTQQLQSSVQISGQIKLLVEDGNHEINRDRNPDLRLDGIGAVSEEVLDPQMAFDPPEKEFDLPAGAINSGHRDRWDFEIVGQKNQVAASLGIEVAQFTQPPTKIRSRSAIRRPA